MYILPAFQNVKTFVFDMDGVLTDGGLYITEENKWLRKMHVRDGYALQLAIKSGYNIIVISGSDSPEVANRLNRLGVQHVFMGVKDKSTILQEWMLANNLELSESLFMGDDIPDYECMNLVGIATCPLDAVSEIKEVATYISPFCGGEGCVRDVIEKVMKLNGKWSLHTNTTST
ncbi:MAG: HAD-IIIA family hydrolase [Ginsengibacter sp.]